MGGERTDERVLVTGGASFIGSHLVEEPVARDTDRNDRGRVAADLRELLRER